MYLKSGDIGTARNGKTVGPLTSSKNGQWLTCPQHHFLYGRAQSEGDNTIINRDVPHEWDILSVN